MYHVHFAVAATLLSVSGLLQTNLLNVPAVSVNADRLTMRELNDYWGSILKLLKLNSKMTTQVRRLWQLRVFAFTLLLQEWRKVVILDFNLSNPSMLPQWLTSYHVVNLSAMTDTAGTTTLVTYVNITHNQSHVHAKKPTQDLQSNWATVPC